jgi:hypothetical protein
MAKDLLILFQPGRICLIGHNLLALVVLDYFQELGRRFDRSIKDSFELSSPDRWKNLCPPEDEVVTGELFRKRRTKRRRKRKTWQ